MRNQSLKEATIQQPDFPQLRMWKEIAILAQMIMELAWIVPWYRSLTRGTNQAETWRVFAVFLTILLLFFWLSRAMNFFNIRLLLRRTILLGLLIFVSLFGLRYLLYFSEPVSIVDVLTKPVAAFSNLMVLIPDEFVILLAMIFIAFRGVTMASQRTSPTDMLVRFQIGLVMIVLYILLNTLVTGEAPGNIIFVFLFAGLIAIGTARMTVMERLRGGREVPFDRKWFFGLLVSTLAVILAAFAASQFTKYPLFDILIQAVTAIFSLLVGILLILLMPIFLLLISGLMWLLENARMSDLLPEIVGDLQSALNNLSDLTGRLFAFARDLLPDLSFTRPYILLFGILLVIVLGLLFLGINWLVRNYKDLEIDDVESLLEAGDWLGLLKNILQTNLKKMGQNFENRLIFSHRDRRRAAERIRQIYQELVAIGSELGVERDKAETPYEYLPRLQALFIHHSKEVAEITNAYIKIRYGEYPESMAEVDEIERDWQALQKAAKDLQSVDVVNSRYEIQ